MPRAFNEREQAQIRSSLRAAGRRLFALTGVAKTSVDQLTAAAGIAKGSFYRFYDSKELLFMDLLEEAEEAIRAPMLGGRASSRAAFEKLLRRLFEDLCADPLIMLMGRQAEFLHLIRRLPPGTLAQHEKRDQEFLDALIRRWNGRRVAPKRDVIAARMTLLVMLAIQRDFFGERLFPHAVDAAISGLSDSLFPTL